MSINRGKTRQFTPFEESRLIGTLLKSPLLKNVSLTVLRDLLRLADQVEYSRGEVVHGAGEGPLRQGLLVLGGELRVVAADGFTVGAASKEGIGGASRELSLYRGDSFGETCLLTGEVWKGEITAQRRPALRYAAILHFQERAELAHAQLTLGAGMMKLGSATDTEFGRLMTQPDHVSGAESQSAYVVV